MYCCSCGPKLAIVRAAAKAHPDGFTTSELWEDLAMRGRPPLEEHLPGMLRYLGYIEEEAIWMLLKDPGSARAIEGEHMIASDYLLSIRFIDNLTEGDSCENSIVN
jgi:hypothetical protein